MRLMLDDQYAAMPWDEIDNVVFDVGNVLLAFSPEDILQKYLPDQPELHPLLLERIFHSPYWPMMDRGLLTCQEAITPMTGRHAELLPAVTRIMTEWVYLDAIDEGVAALHACKAHGKKLYVLSNYGASAFPIAMQRHSFFQLFDGIVVSSREHMVKPEGRIYRLLTDRYQLDPTRTLFIDDSPANIESALLEGWQGICYNRRGKLTDFFGL